MKKSNTKVYLMLIANMHDLIVFLKRVKLYQLTAISN